MSSDYGDCFGFRRSDESVAVREGRLRTPVGSAYKLGTLVSQDDEEFLTQAGASAHVVAGYTGLLVQEEVWDRGIYESNIVDSFQLGVAKPDRLSVIVTGAGVKFWIKNRLASTRADGRALPAVTMYTATSVAVGDGLAWDGSKYVHVAAGDATEVARVTFYDSESGLLEAVLVK